MQKQLLLLIVAGSLATFSASAQRVVDREVKYEYQRLPLTPIDKSVKNFQVTVLAPYEAENDKAQQDYKQALGNVDNDFASAQAAHAKAVADVKVDYEQRLAEYNKKSLAEKMLTKGVLNEGKPVLSLPYPPQKMQPQPPVMRQVVDKNALAGSLRLPGYNRGTQNAAVVTVTLYGMELSEPKQNQPGMTVSLSGTAAPAPTYTVDYRYPVGVKVEVPGQGVVVDETLPATNEYKQLRTQSPSLGGPEQRKLTLDPLETKLRDENLKLAQQYLESQFGVTTVSRTTVLYTIEPKKMTYDEYPGALDAALAGYKKLGDEQADARTYFGTALTQWDKALAEAKPTDNKARINGDVAVATYLDAAEAAIWTGEMSRADGYLLKLNTLDLSRRQKRQLADLEILTKDEKKRHAANK